MISSTCCLLMYCSSALMAGASETPYVTWTPEVVDALPSTESASRLTAAEIETLKTAAPPLPYTEITAAVRQGKTGNLEPTVWLGTSRGVLRKSASDARWRVMHSRHWLPDDHVQDIVVTSAGPVVKTAQGNVRLRQTETTLAKKMAAVNDAVQKHHVREGLIGEINLKVPGDLTRGYTQYTSDNDGLWTSMYVAAEAFRYGATGDASAKANARRSLEALMFLHDITGISGFAARSIVPIDDDPKRYGGEWHKSADGRWWWKGDTSSDELDGHYFAYGVYHDLVADESERKRIRGYVKKITDHILDHDYYYVGPPGKPTTWGVWHPDKINHDLNWYVDRGLNSLEMLSHLRVADHIVGEARYQAAARELIDKHAYETNAIDQKILWPANAVNHSDDELAFLAYYPLVWYERDARLRQVYLLSLDRSFQIERPERSPLFNFIYAVGQQASQWTDPMQRPKTTLLPPESYDRTECLEWFRDVHADTIIWSFKNSDRRDVAVALKNRHGRMTSDTALPPSERRVMRWNGDPYELDGGAGGSVRDDGAAILLPYWMGMYHRLID